MMMLLRFLSLFLLFASPAAAQTVLPQFSIDKAGSCRALSVRDIVLGANVQIGCINAGGHKVTGAGLSIVGLIDSDPAGALAVDSYSSGTPNG